MRIPPLVRVIVLFTAIVALGVAGFLFFNQQRGGDDEPSEPLGIAAAGAVAGMEQTGITVEGTGEVQIAPDSAFLSLGVQVVAETAAEATIALSTDSNAVVEAVKEAGVDEADIATQSLTLTPVYAEPGPDRTWDTPPKIDGYRASTTVLVTAHEIDGAAESLDAALSAGANVVNYVRFGVMETAILEQQALDLATRDAARKAEAMAAALGGKVGGLIWIVEQTSGFGGSYPVAKQSIAFADANMAPLVALEAGQLTITARVIANFAYE